MCRCVGKANTYCYTHRYTHCHMLYLQQYYMVELRWWGIYASGMLFTLSGRQFGYSQAVRPW